MGLTPFHRHLGIAHVIVVAAALSSVCALAATPLNAELLINGNAETGNTSGWTAAGMEATGSATAGTAGLPQGVSTGNFVFYGGPGPASGQSLTQSIAVGDLAAPIDAGQITSTFSLLVQSRTYDYGSGELRFLDASAGSLATLAFSDPMSSTFDWRHVQDVRIVPTGTRSIELFLNTKRTTGVSNDAYFDNASLMLAAAVPETGSLWLALGGLPLVGLAALGRRRAGPSGSAGEQDAR